MKQNINLYRPVAHAGSGLDARAIVIAWGVTVLLASVTQFWLGQRNSAVTGAIGQTRLDVAAAEERFNEMTASMMAGADSELETRLSEALRELDLRETILGLVSGDSAGDIRGFSGQLRSFARQHAEGVWLTRVRLTAPGARTTLEGKALSPEAVPLYLRQLSGEAALAGQSFDVFEIERAEAAGDPIRFSMNRRDVADSIQYARE
ncbi:MAG: PilN domain-containing protein [Gammaproteobacteria bacterium]|nr:PilN domain-containing protein [Gammaproteobacteria bacterium]